MELLYSNKIKENQQLFLSKVVEISNRLNINPNWLMAAINFETAGTFNHKIENLKFPFKNGYATGLIQFTPDTAKGLNTSTEALKNMQNYEQLEYVYKYLLPYKNKIKSFVDLYLSIFFPLAVGRPSYFIIQAKDLTAEKIAKANPIFDINKDQKITIAEIEKTLLSKLPDNLTASFKKKGGAVGGLIIFAAVTFFFIKKYIKN